MAKLVITSVGLSVVLLAVIIPVLEINPSHLTNPEWPAHARLHEAWQLMTNAVIAVFAFGCVWTNRAPRIGISLMLLICASFLIALMLAPSYGGSMLRDDGTQFVIGGINVVVLVVMVLFTLLLTSLWRIWPTTKLPEDGAAS